MVIHFWFIAIANWKPWVIFWEKMTSKQKLEKMEEQMLNWLKFNTKMQFMGNSLVEQTHPGPKRFFSSPVDRYLKKILKFCLMNYISHKCKIQIDLLRMSTTRTTHAKLCGMFLKTRESHSLPCEISSSFSTQINCARHKACCGHQCNRSVKWWSYAIFCWESVNRFSVAEIVMASLRFRSFCFGRGRDAVENDK